MAHQARSAQAAGDRTEAAALDAIDREIVTLLSVDARLSIRAIARRIGRSPGAVGERLSRLEHSGIITGYFADIDFSQLGLMRTLLGIRITDDSLLDGCVESITALDEVKRVWVVTGSWAVMAEAYVRNAAHLRELLQVRMRAIEGVQHTEAMIVLGTTAAPDRTAGVVESLPVPGAVD